LSVGSSSEVLSLEKDNSDRDESNFVVAASLLLAESKKLLNFNNASSRHLSGQRWQLFPPSHVLLSLEVISIVGAS
jgi:hypothetical protein